MNIDFALILVLLSAVTGLIWLFDVLYLKKRRQAARISEGDAEAREPAVVEYSKSFFPVLFVILLIRSFLVEPFTIPSASMVPSLLIGDFILVNKFAYGLRLPVANTKILDVGEPERGDVIVFRYPLNEKQNYVKRLIGLPGDEIRYDQHMIYVNGEPAAQRSVGRYVGQGSNAESTGSELLIEDLGEVEHQILTISARDRSRNSWVVPEGQYFVMGDNRDNSQDSRSWGMVPEQNLVGRAFFVWMHWDWKLPGFVSWRRIGTTVE
jgi:signal peptidase I